MSDNEIHASEDQLAKVIDILKNPPCRFNDIEVKRIHRLADMLTDEGLDNIREVIVFGGRLKASKKIGDAVMIAALISSAIGALWLGFLKLVERG